MRSQLEQDVFSLLPGEELSGPYADGTGDYTLTREDDGTYILALALYEVSYPSFPTQIFWKGEEAYTTAGEAFGALSCVADEPQLPAILPVGKVW